MGDEKDRKLLFSLDGVNIDDETELQGFAERVWQATMEAWKGESMNDTTGDTGSAETDPRDIDSPGPVILTPRYTEAVTYAAALHGTSTRKGTNVTYLCHLFSVSALILEAGGSEDQAIAGLLHDAVEDAGGIPRARDIAHRFGRTVADIVLACSDSTDEEWKKQVDYCQRKRAYLDHLEHEASDDAVLVSIADKVHNARATVTDLRREGADVLDKFNGPSRSAVVWYYTELLRIARARHVTDALVIPLTIAVEEIQSHVDGPWECS